MANTYRNKDWATVFQENCAVVQRYLSRGGKRSGAGEVEFRATFGNRPDALSARNELSAQYSKKYDRQVFIIGPGDDGGKYDCLLSVKIPIEAELITQLELAFSEVVERHSGRDVGWGFLSGGHALN